jgi:hypothetical protein
MAAAYILQGALDMLANLRRQAERDAEDESSAEEWTDRER